MTVLEEFYYGAVTVRECSIKDASILPSTGKEESLGGHRVNWMSLFPTECRLGCGSADPVKRYVHSSADIPDEFDNRSQYLDQWCLSSVRPCQER